MSCTYRNDSSWSAASALPQLLRDMLKVNKDPFVEGRIHLCLAIVRGQEQFVEDSLSPESELRLKIVKDTYTDPKTAGISGMLSGHLIGDCAKIMAEMVQAKSILEIGMFTGYGAVTLAESAFCEEVVSLDFDPYMESFLKERIKETKLENKIRIMTGKANDSLVILKDEKKKFDLVFIDADKTGYLGYYKYIMDNGLLSPQGIFICDNIMWQNDTFLDRRTEGGKVLWDFVEYVKKDNRVDQIIFPMRDGVLLIKPKVHLTE